MAGPEAKCTKEDVETKLSINLRIPVTVYGEEELSPESIKRLEKYLSDVINEYDANGPNTRLCFNGEIFRHVLDGVLKGMERMQHIKEVYTPDTSWEKIPVRIKKNGKRKL